LNPEKSSRTQSKIKKPISHWLIGFLIYFNFAFKSLFAVLKLYRTNPPGDPGEYADAYGSAWGK
jgi:hypothetical protein